MEKICPVCNGLQNLAIHCPRCGLIMAEEGSITDFLGPYSPYFDRDLLELNNNLLVEGPDPCVHLLTCANCQVERRVIVELVLI